MTVKVVVTGRTGGFLALSTPVATADGMDPDAARDEQKGEKVADLD